MTLGLALALLWMPVSALAAGGIVYWIATRPDPSEQPRYPAE